MERSSDWIEQAGRDLDHARRDMDGRFFEWACFSAQQSAEKATNAVLQKMGVIAWGHSVADLLGEISQSHPVSDELMDKALELDKAYIPTRYPDALQSGSPGGRYTRGEAQRLIQHAEEILQFSESLLSAL